MSEIGIRELKAKASELVRRVAEEHAVYTITRRGRPVGVLAPADFAGARGGAAGREAWARLLGIAERMAKQPGPRNSALEELFKMRRERDDTLCGRR
jgi:prevent-host-death family protein